MALKMRQHTKDSHFLDNLLISFRNRKEDERKLQTTEMRMYDW